MLIRQNSPTVVIFSRDWQSRALLRAQLIEEGFRVKAYLSAADAAAATERKTQRPALVIADLSGEVSRDDEEALAVAAQRTPVWVIASSTAAGETELRERGVEAVFFRPLRLGELAARVRQRLMR